MLCAAFLIVLWVAPDIMLVVFAGLLMAVFLRGGGHWIARKAHVPDGAGLAIFCFGLALLVGGFFAFAGAALADQVQKLVDFVPTANEIIQRYVARHDWTRRVIETVDFQSMLPSGRSATATLSSTFGMLGNAVVIVFVGLYAAISPKTYVDGFAMLIAPSLREGVKAMLREAAGALRGWLKAQFTSMAVIGVLTWLGLWVLGVPLAPILGVLAALLTFIPNIGPILAAVPAVLLGLSEGASTALWIVGLYVAVQSVESYLVTPHVQKEAVSLPPALTISVQVLFGVLFGIIGLALATPIAAVALRIGKLFYVHRYLDREAPDADFD